MYWNKYGHGNYPVLEWKRVPVLVVRIFLLRDGTSSNPSSVPKESIAPVPISIEGHTGSALLLTHRGTSAAVRKPLFRFVPALGTATASPRVSISLTTVQATLPVQMSRLVGFRNCKCFTCNCFEFVGSPSLVLLLCDGCLGFAGGFSEKGCLIFLGPE